MSEPRISFVKYDWPSTEDGKIPTAQFLDSCGTILQVLGALGKMFMPVKRDIHGNIIKLQHTYNRSPQEYSTLNGIIQNKTQGDSATAIEALLWLKRGLHFIYLLLDSIIEGYETNLTDTSIVNASLNAYEKTLKSCHPWALQKVIITCMKSPIWPRRNDILNSIAHGADETVVVPELKHFVKGLGSNLKCIFHLYTSHGLDTVNQL